MHQTKYIGYLLLEIICRVNIPVCGIFLSISSVSCRKAFSPVQNHLHLVNSTCFKNVKITLNTNYQTADIWLHITSEIVNVLNPLNTFSISTLIYAILVFCLDFCLCLKNSDLFLYLVSLGYPKTIDKPN